MLYLHCGWMKTGTTSLRSALAEHRDALADAGMVFAQQWRSLTRDLSNSSAETAIVRFRSFLEGHSGEDVLCSNEWLTRLVWEEQSRESFEQLLAVAEEVMPVRCVWTLRRFDELIISVYLWLLRRADPPLPVQELHSFPGVEETIIGMRKLEDGVAASMEYLAYDSGGGHTRPLLCALGVPASLRQEIERKMTTSPRRNTAIGLRQAVALLNAEALSARSGAPFDRARLQMAFNVEGFRFESDAPCRLADAHTREVLHGRALKAARECEFEPYIRFFADAPIPLDQPPHDLGMEAIDDRNLACLVDHLRGSVVRE
jgi:hypothetical protein